ncbi:MAG: hypothetical protein KJ968_05910 [Nanoarchaeota archaeon]|nr:hypothetical protein [Nanoarchaeota archaeon]
MKLFIRKAELVCLMCGFKMKTINVAGANFMKGALSYWPAMRIERFI